MQASASGMAAPFGPAHHDQPRGAQRFVAEEIVGSRHAILDATHPIVAARIGTGPPRIGVSRVGARKCGVCRRASPALCTREGS